MTAILAAMLTAGCGTAGNIVSVETSTTENSITKTNNTEESITGASNTEENTTVESSTQEAQDAYLAFIEDLEDGEATVTEGEIYGEAGTPVTIQKGAEANGFRLYDFILEALKSDNLSGSASLSFPSLSHTLINSYGQI